jgi:uncharacterized protein (DUF2384 family)
MRIEEGQQVVRRLLKLYDEQEAITWMNSPHKLLGGRKPRDCSKEEVLVVVEQLETGAFR